MPGWSSAVRARRLALNPLSGPIQLLGRPVQGQAFERDFGAVWGQRQVDHAHTAATEAADKVVGHGLRHGRQVRVRLPDPTHALTALRTSIGGNRRPARHVNGL